MRLTAAPRAFRKIDASYASTHSTTVGPRPTELTKYGVARGHGQVSAHVSFFTHNGASYPVLRVPGMLSLCVHLPL